MDLDGIKQLGPSTWSVRVKRVDSRTGKKCDRKDTVEGSRADAIRRRDEIRAELAGAGRPRGAPITLRAFTLAWLERRRDQLKPSVATKYLYSARHALLELGELLVEAIVPSDVETYVAKRLRAGAAGNTVLNELRLLRTIARAAQRDEVATRYFADGVAAPRCAKYSDARPNRLTPAQAKLVLQHIAPQWMGLVLFLMLSGLRIGEATALRWDDVDVITSEAHIRRNNWRGLEGDVKTDGSNRGVPAIAEVVALWGKPRPGELIFPSRYGTHHRGSPLRRVLDKACAAAGVPRVTTHGLRRTFNDAARQRSSREVVKAITGHETDEMLEHYSHVDAGEKALLSRAILAAIGVLQVSEPRTPDIDK